MKKDEWIAACAAQYATRGGLDEAGAKDAAETAYEARFDDNEDPVNSADNDMDCWDDDEGGGGK